MSEVTQLLKNWYHLALACAANIFYGFPSRKLKVIGVTGTDGKTTTTHLIYHILTFAGKKTSMISSVFAQINGKSYDTGFHVTTPDIIPLQKFLHDSAHGGDEYFVLETTSHALSQNRAWGISYYASVLTNITHEHLDFHRNYESYAKAKAILLNKSTISVINRDDQSYDLLTRLLKKNITTYGLEHKADYSLDIAEKLNIELPSFNRYNYLAAFSVCRMLGIEEKIILEALKTFKLPQGRLEVISTKPITVIVDFAHTPNAILEVLKNTKKIYLKKGGRLIHVFGSAGRRDQTKRPMMGESSGSYADLVVLTEEDYRDENPNDISRQIATGLEKKDFKEQAVYEFGNSSKKYTIVIDREKAIHEAFTIAKPGDVIILTGKGHEKSLCRGKKEYPWSDIDAAREELKKRS